jgi:hypothetical protein
MRAILLLLLIACDNSDQNADMSVVGTCPAPTHCNPTDECTYLDGDGQTCICVSPELVSCCAGGPVPNCMTGRTGAVCCGAPIGLGHECVNGCQCNGNHWVCSSDGGGV